MTNFPRPITREQFELVRTLVETHRRQTRPRRHDLYDVLCLVLYREQNKLPWRALPDIGVAWRSVHEYHVNWTMPPRDGGIPLLDRVKTILKESP